LITCLANASEASGGTCLAKLAKQAKADQGRMTTMGLRDKYAHAVQTAKNLRMQGSADERDGKLYFKGTVQTQDEANKIWDAIKTIPDWGRGYFTDEDVRRTRALLANRGLAAVLDATVDYRVGMVPKRSFGPLFSQTHTAVMAWRGVRKRGTAPFSLTGLSA
jgi:hypothetical protein